MLKGTPEERWVAIYAAAFVAEWQDFRRSGRSLDDDDVARFVEEAKAMADWSSEGEALAAREFMSLLGKK
jgi:hypothetical protein